VTELYVHRGFWVRYVALLIFLALVFVYGCFELWRAAYQPGAGASGGIMFGIFFVGGSLYALRIVLQENRDLVISLARNNENGELAASVFARFNAADVAAPPSAFGNWRLDLKKLGRNRVAFFIHADCTAWRRPLRFDLKPGTDLSGLRTLAPDAIAEFEGAGNRPPTAAG
jgi:hypothetical protein